jgi:hypothetical protein
MIGAQVAPGTSRNQPGEHDMESVDGLGAGLHQVIAVLDDSAQSRGSSIDLGSAQRR